MRRTGIVVALALAAGTLAGVASAEIEGRWTLDARDHGDRVQLGLKRSWQRGGSHGSWSHTTDVSRATIRGLAEAERRDGPVSLQLVREAGTIHMEGRLDDGRGGGRFTFEPDRGFAADLERSGLGPVRDEDLVRLCVGNLGRDWIRDAHALGLRKLSIDGLLRLMNNDVSPAFVRELTAAGYEGLEVDEVVRLRSNGVTPEYVRAIGAGRGRRPSVEELVRFRSNGVEAGFVTALTPHFESEEILRLHNNGVSSDYVRDFRSLGYESASANDLIRLRNNDVSPSFARRAVKLHGRLTTEELIKLRVNGLE